MFASQLSRGSGIAAWQNLRGCPATHCVVVVELYFVWPLSIDLFGLVKPARRRTPADIALRVPGTHKPPYRDKA